VVCHVHVGKPFLPVLTLTVGRRNHLWDDWDRLSRGSPFPMPFEALTDLVTVPFDSEASPLLWCALAWQVYSCITAPAICWYH
jgi:hypothetical protein